MGGAVSTGRNNEDLVDNLLSADYIRTPVVEKLFRSVDRADYFLPQFKRNAYKDLAWKSGNLHLSAPCIYSEVMEGLCMKPNMSFLNLGSGTGYLSTMAGLAIGSGGINHGVEIFPDVIEYACKKLEEFKRYSSAIDEFDFCEPKFVQGNCLCLSIGALQYDRVYCGGACPSVHINYMKKLIKVGGILIMPIEDQLMQIERTSETTWEERSLLPVSFATLILPEKGSFEFVNMVDVEPLSLQEICRTVIRNVLRNNINTECPKLKLLPQRNNVPKKKYTVKRKIVPLLDTSDEGSDGEETNRVAERPINNNNQRRSIGAFIDIVLGRIPDPRHALFNTNSSVASSNANNSVSSNEPNASSDSMEFDSRTEHQENSNDTKSDTDSQENAVNKLNSMQIETDAPSTSTATEQPSETSTEVASGNGTVLARIMIRKRNRERDDGIEEDAEDSEEECNKENITPTKPKVSETVSATKSKREKFDSGLGDEIAGTSSDGETTSPTEDHRNGIEGYSSSISDDDDDQRGSNNEQSSETSFSTLRGRHWRTVTVPSYAVDHLLGHMDDETAEEGVESAPPPQPFIGPYTIHMRNKIQELPLPQTMKNYLNYYKEF